MDETRVFFDMVPNKSFAKKGFKSVVVRKSSYEKIEVTVAKCEDILSPMIIFPVKIGRTVKDLTVPNNLCIVTQEKAWINERLMMVWYEKICQRYVRERTKVFFKSLMVVDAFKAHFMDGVAAVILIGHTGFCKSRTGCTPKVQLLDVSSSKPFKSVLREY